MNLVKFIEKNFLIVLVLAIVFGLLVPVFGIGQRYLILPLFMVIFFLTCLKIDYIAIFSHIKKPIFMTYIVLMYLLIIPAVMYMVFNFLAPQIALGILLLVSVPPAAAAPFFTSLVKGNVSLSIAVSIICYIFAPLTISFLFYIFTKQSIDLDLWGMMQTLILVNFIPLIAAQIVRKTAKPVIEKTQSYFGIVNISLLFILIYIAVSNQAKEILAHSIIDMVINVLWIYFFLILLHIIGYFMAFRMKKEDKIALSITKTYTNIGLAIGLAATFFSPQILFLMVVAELPWNTCLGLLKPLIKYLK
jgi:BASS family bile acid:Na+ symporter